MTDEKDTYFSRAQADLELRGQGRFIKEVTTQVIASGPVPIIPNSPRRRRSLAILSRVSLLASTTSTPAPKLVAPPKLWGFRLWTAWSLRCVRYDRSQSFETREKAAVQESHDVWTDPSTLTDEQIESKLFELGKKLTEAGVAGGKICELESVKWRLEFEQKFREQRKG
jgi:hypothetical protein